MRINHVQAALLMVEMVLWSGTPAAADSLHPILNMCQRWNHQSTIKNNILYIDGGFETFVPTNDFGSPKGTITVGTNNYLIEVDMGKSWNWKESGNISETYTTKNANPATGSFPPQVVRGALYSGLSSDSKIYLYGGSTSMLNQSFAGYKPPEPAQYSLWSYDTDSLAWNQHDTTLETPQRPNAGASAEAPDQGLAFFFNGQMDNGTSVATQYMDGQQEFLDGMVVIDTTTQTTRNISTPNNASDGHPQSRAQMTYLPGIGEKGILVAIGGSWKNLTQVDDVEIGNMVPMDTVTVFDIASLANGGNGTWYQQSTSGDTPPARVDHCIVAVSAPDNSSHQISVYGGRSSESNMIDDLWTLSIPAFHWTKLYSGGSPRYGHSCHVVGNRQLLTVGGSLTQLENITDACDWEMKGVAIWDMSSRQWGQVFDAYAAPYTVPDLIVQDIGGTLNGGANFTVPKNGFSSQGLATLISTTRSWASNKTTTPNDPFKSSASPALSVSTIVGIAIGVTICVFLVVAGVWMRYFSGRNKARRASTRDSKFAMVEADGSEVQEKDSWSSRPDSNARNSRFPPELLNTTGYLAELAGPNVAAELQSPNEKVDLYSPAETAVEIGTPSTEDSYKRQKSGAVSGKNSRASKGESMNWSWSRSASVGRTDSAADTWKPLPPAPVHSPATPTEPEPAHLPTWVVEREGRF